MRIAIALDLGLRRSDTTFIKGKVGLWTKADSVTAFRDFEVTAE